MPIKIAEELPARAILEQENIFVMSEQRALHQDIRPLRIAILNLMPKKIETETQLMRLLSNTPLQVEPTLLQMASHVSKHTASEHLTQFYKTFADVRHEYFDGMVITGAPVELLPFEEVDYWEELSAIFRWSKKHVFSTLHICWGAQAGLYYHYGIEKAVLSEKLFGVFSHRVLVPNHPLMRGFDERYAVPHSRYTTSVTEQVLACDRLQVLSASEEAGLHVIASRDHRQFFVTGHSEYDRDTLAQEYRRDAAKGLDTALPRHYFPNDDPSKEPCFIWRGHAHLLFSNWLNYFVYQMTPYALDREFEE